MSQHQDHKMNINTTNSQHTNQIQSLLAVESEQNIHKNGALEKGVKTNGGEINISRAGQVGSYIASLPEAEQQEIKEYMQSVREEKANGNFDIATSISNAPEAFNNLASQLNLASADALDIMSAKPIKNTTSSPTEQVKPPSISAYADVAAQATTNTGSNSVFEMFSSLFSSDSKSLG